MWKLTPDQLAHTAAALTGVDAGVSARLKPFETETHSFSNESDRLDASLTYFGEAFNVASDLGRSLVADLGKLATCLPQGIDDDGCIRSVVSEFGARLARRPLSEEEITEQVSFFGTQVPEFGRSDALGMVVRRLLAGPTFLYRSEMGQMEGGKIRLTPYEIASAVSYFLIDGPPDAGLLESARSGAMRDKDEIARQVKRLLSSRQSAIGVMKLFGEFLALDKIATRTPDIPNREAVLSSMPEESNRFIENVLWHDGSRLTTLLAAPYTFVDANLAVHYGAQNPVSAWSKITLTDRPGGLLTQAAQLTSRKTTTPRGVFVRERLLCQKQPAPPANVDTDLEKRKQDLEKAAGKTLTRREVRQQHTGSAACSGCHSLLDPLGFALDNYDTSGRYQARVDGAPVATAGSIVGTAHSDGPVTDAADLVAKLSHSSDVADCFVQQVYEYAYGKAAAETDGCFLADLRSKFAASGGDVIQLVVDIATQDAFVTRSPMSEK